MLVVAIRRVLVLPVRPVTATCSPDGATGTTTEPVSVLTRTAVGVEPPVLASNLTFRPSTVRGASKRTDQDAPGAAGSDVGAPAGQGIGVDRREGQVLALRAAEGRRVRGAR